MFKKTSALCWSRKQWISQICCFFLGYILSLQANKNGWKESTSCLWLARAKDSQGYEPGFGVCSFFRQIIKKCPWHIGKFKIHHIKTYYFHLPPKYWISPVFHIFLLKTINYSPPLFLQTLNSILHWNPGLISRPAPPKPYWIPSAASDNSSIWWTGGIMVLKSKQLWVRAWDMLACLSLQIFIGTILPQGNVALSPTGVQGIRWCLKTGRCCQSTS